MLLLDEPSKFVVAFVFVFIFEFTERGEETADDDAADDADADVDRVPDADVAAPFIVVEFDNVVVVEMLAEGSLPLLLVTVGRRRLCCALRLLSPSTISLLAGWLAGWLAAVGWLAAAGWLQ